MWKTLSLVLPVLIPSWRFFKAIEPSPRVQWALLADGEGTDAVWHEFRPRPQAVTLWAMVARLFWNPLWNDTLFVVSCAERIAEQPTAHSIAEIEHRILHEIHGMQPTAVGYVQFRLVFVHRDADDLAQEVVFRSDPFSIPEAAAP